MRSDVRLRPIALPAEHGSWGLVLEPIVLGLLVAPTGAGFCLGLGAFASFLTRRPFKVAWAQSGGTRSERARIATAFFAGYALIAAVAFLTALWLSGVRPLLPLLGALPFAAVFLAYDALGLAVVDEITDNLAQTVPGTEFFSTVDGDP